MTLATVLFDEAHSEAWTIRPELAETMQPAHPGDCSYALAAAALTADGFTVASNSTGPLSAEALAGCDVLVIAHPSDPVWEKTTGSGSPRLTAAELDAIERFVHDGGGLVVLGETEQEKYGNNLNVLLERFGVHLENDTVQDYEHHHGAPSWILAELSDGDRGRGGDVLARVKQACLYRATTVTATNGARVLARSHATASTPGAPLIVAGDYGDGRVIVLGDSDLFGDDCIGELDHRALWLNIVHWLARPEATGNDVASAGPAADPAWTELRDDVNALGQLQAPDGALDRRRRRERRARPTHADRCGDRASRPRTSRTTRPTWRPSSRISAPGRQAASSSPTSPGRWTRSARTWSAATGWSISSCSRCTSRTAPGTRALRRCSCACRGRTGSPSWNGPGTTTARTSRSS